MKSSELELEIESKTSKKHSENRRIQGLHVGAILKVQMEMKKVSIIRIIKCITGRLLKMLSSSTRENYFGSLAKLT